MLVDLVKSDNESGPGKKTGYNVSRAGLQKNILSGVTHSDKRKLLEEALLECYSNFQL